MRSQQEILLKIEEITRSQSDPMKVQRKVLIRKLDWKHAKEFMKVDKALDPTLKSNWAVTSSQEDKLINAEMDALMYQAYDNLIEFDFGKCLIFSQIFMIFAWLTRKGPLLNEIIFRLPLVPPDDSMKPFFFKSLFDKVCNEFALNPIAYMRDWEDPTKPWNQRGVI